MNLRQTKIKPCTFIQPLHVCVFEKRNKVWFAPVYESSYVL